MECRLNVRWIAAAQKPNFDRSLAGLWDGRAPVTGRFRFCVKRNLQKQQELTHFVHYSVQGLNISYDMHVNSGI